MSQLKQELSELYDQASNQLFYCALAVTSSADLAEDAVHDAFIRAFRLREKPKNLKAYMFRSVRNAAVDIVRRQTKVVQPATDDIFENQGQSKLLEHGLDVELVARALSALPANQREIVLQHLVAGLTFREISELQDRPMGTITTWYRRGIEALRNKVSKHHE
jgi:RNA polymerase sigma-70 factor (ECF subfamily)